MVKLKALVIDDSRVMRNMVMQALNKANLAEFEFVEAEDGQDGLKKFDPEEIHIGFVDWNMPNINGIDFVRAVRSKEEDGELRIPLVMVTSEKTMSKIEEALDEAGADSFITKPFTPEELSAKLKKVIEKAGHVAIRRARERREAQEAAPKSGGFFGGLFG